MSLIIKMSPITAESHMKKAISYIRANGYPVRYISFGAWKSKLLLHRKMPLPYSHVCLKAVLMPTLACCATLLEKIPFMTVQKPTYC